MSNPSKQKGTGAETELLRRLNARGFRFARREASARADLRQESYLSDTVAPAFSVLATRPDRGQWLFTIDEDTFCLLINSEDRVDVEVKRYKAFAHHAIWEGKFGGR